MINSKEQSVYWEPCTEENYWTEKEGYTTIVKFLDDDGTVYVYTQNECPYGWNVLERNNAMKMDIKL